MNKSTVANMTTLVEFEQLKISYNAEIKKRGIDELIATHVQEDGRMNRIRLKMLI